MHIHKQARKQNKCGFVFFIVKVHAEIHDANAEIMMMRIKGSRSAAHASGLLASSNILWWGADARMRVIGKQPYSGHFDAQVPR